MARVCLTEKQRKEAAECDAIKKMYQIVIDSLAVKMNREKMTREQAGEMLGICCPSVSRLLGGKDLQINIKVVFKLLYILGLEIKPRNQA